MMITFARTVAVDADLDAEEADLVATAERWVLMSELSGTFDPMPPVTVSRSDTFSFVDTGGTVMQGLEMVTEYGILRQILLEAKVEVDE